MPCSSTVAAMSWRPAQHRRLVLRQTLAPAVEDVLRALATRVHPDVRMQACTCTPMDTQSAPDAELPNHDSLLMLVLDVEALVWDDRHRGAARPVALADRAGWDGVVLLGPDDSREGAKRSLAKGMARDRRAAATTHGAGIAPAARRAAAGERDGARRAGQGHATTAGAPVRGGGATVASRVRGASGGCVTCDVGRPVSGVQCTRHVASRVATCCLRRQKENQTLSACAARMSRKRLSSMGNHVSWLPLSG